MLECIYCSSKKINKSIMAPMVKNLKNTTENFELIDKKFKNEKDYLFKLRKYIEDNCDYVGNDFSKKIREVYYDKKNNRAIYGKTTPEEREELREEGIDLFSIPWIDKDN